MGKQNKFVQLKSDVVSEWEEVYLGTITEEEEEKPRRRTKRPSVAQLLLEEKEEKKKDAIKKKEREEDAIRQQINNCLERMNKLLMVEVQLKRAEQKHREFYRNEMDLLNEVTEAQILLQKIDTALLDH